MAFTVGIAGITGKFATLVLEQLLISPDVQIRGYCRNASKLPEATRESPRIEIVEGDVYDTSTLQKFVIGCRVVICGYLGDNDLMERGQKLLVDACEAEGVSRYIASDYSLDYNKLEYGQHVAKDPMKVVKEYLETKQTVKGVHVLIGAFMDTFWSAYFAVWDPKSETLSYWGSGEEDFESTSYRNASEFVAAVALDTSAVGVQKYVGDRKSSLQIAQVFEEVYGRKMNLERRGSLEELYPYMHEQAKEKPDDILAWLPLFYQYYTLNGQTYLGSVDNKYNIKPETFADFMRSHDINKQ